MPEVPWLRPAVGAVLALVVISFANCSYTIVEPGTVGVVTHFGAVQDEVLPEGLHLIMPVKTKVVPIDVRVQKVEDTASASSRDLQVVSSTVALNYYLSKDHANTIFQELGPGYRSTVIGPAIQESVKSSTAQFTAEELITRRSEVKDSIFASIKKRLQSYNLIVTDFSIVDFKFSPEFNKAIEDKQVAEQRALRAVNDLERIKTEAQQAQAKAEGEANAKLALARSEAQAQQLLRETLTGEVIRLRAIEKWNGVLPSVSSGEGALPFISVNAGSSGVTR